MSDTGGGVKARDLAGVNTDLANFIATAISNDLADARMAAVNGGSVWGEPLETMDESSGRWVQLGSRIMVHEPSEHLEDFLVLRSPAYATARVRALRAVLHEAVKIADEQVRYHVLLALARAWEDCAA